MNRATIIPVLVQALAKSKQSLDPATAQEASRIILRAHGDPDDAVRSFTVSALASFGSEDMIPALQEIARADRASEKAENGSQWFPIRESATKAIGKIQQRAGAVH
jgi:HEAT repeat protein